MGSAQSADLKILFNALSRRRRRQLVAVALLMPVTAVAEMLMIAAIVPSGISPRWVVAQSLQL